MKRMGIIGAGSIAVTLCDTVNKMRADGHREVELYAVAARDLGRAEKFAQDNGVAHAYGSYAELCADPKVDFVYIATPHNFHYEQAKLALEGGKHVLCEKAFTRNHYEAERLCALAKDKGLLLTEAIWTRYQPMRKIINDKIFSGVVGEPYLISANLCYAISHNARLIDPNLAGGALLDVGVYTLNFADMIFGHPKEAFGHCLLSEQGVDLTDSITLTYPQGHRLASLYASALAIGDREGVISCSEGFIKVENINNPQKISIYNKNYELIEETYCPPQYTGYEYELYETVSSIEQGLLECPSMPHADTLYMMGLMDRLRASFGVIYPGEREEREARNLA